MRKSMLILLLAWWLVAPAWGAELPREVRDALPAAAEEITEELEDPASLSEGLSRLWDRALGYVEEAVRQSIGGGVVLLAAAVLAAAIPFFLPHMHDRYFFAADALTLALAATWPQLALPALLCEFASLLGYHAYLRMRYLLPMADGALALIAALIVLTAALVMETHQNVPAERKTKKST